MWYISYYRVERFFDRAYQGMPAINPPSGGVKFTLFDDPINGTKPCKIAGWAIQLLDLEDGRYGQLVSTTRKGGVVCAVLCHPEHGKFEFYVVEEFWEILDFKQDQLPRISTNFFEDLE